MPGQLKFSGTLEDLTGKVMEWTDPMGLERWKNRERKSGGDLRYRRLLDGILQECIITSMSAEFMKIAVIIKATRDMMYARARAGMSQNPPELGQKKAYENAYKRLWPEVEKDTVEGIEEQAICDVMGGAYEQACRLFWRISWISDELLPQRALDLLQPQYLLALRPEDIQREAGIFLRSFKRQKQWERRLKAWLRGEALTSEN